MFASSPFWTRPAICCALALSACASFAVAVTPAPNFTNSLGMEFTLIEPGSFTMGKTVGPRLNDLPEGNYDQQPAHKVTLTTRFYILNAPMSQSHFKSTLGFGSLEDVSWS